VEVDQVLPFHSESGLTVAAVHEWCSASVSGMQVVGSNPMCNSRSNLELHFES